MNAPVPQLFVLVESAPFVFALGAAALWHANAIRTCCATTLCAIRSPAYGNYFVCCVSDWVGLPRVDRHVEECWELLSFFCPESPT